MKRVFLLIVSFSLGSLAMAQSVENIRVESEGENILVHYRIGGSTDAQTYEVILSCSIDGGPRFEPKTIIGDVGQNIRGGKSNYTVTWDVFEDLEEVGDVEFFVKINLVTDMSQGDDLPQNQAQVQPDQTQETFDRRAYLAYTGSFLSPVGLSFGVVKNFGFYLSFRFGSYQDYSETDVWGTGTVGVSKYILTRGKYRLHAFGGIGSTYEVYEEYEFNTSWSDSFFTVDFGIINVIGRFNVTLGLEVIAKTGSSGVFGVGYVF